MNVYFRVTNLSDGTTARLETYSVTRAHELKDMLERKNFQTGTIFSVDENYHREKAEKEQAVAFLGEIL